MGIRGCQRQSYVTLWKRRSAKDRSVICASAMVSTTRLLIEGQGEGWWPVIGISLNQYTFVACEITVGLLKPKHWRMRSAERFRPFAFPLNNPRNLCEHCSAAIMAPAVLPGLRRVPEG